MYVIMDFQAYFHVNFSILHSLRTEYNQKKSHLNHEHAYICFYYLNFPQEPTYYLNTKSKSAENSKHIISIYHGNRKHVFVFILENEIFLLYSIKTF